MKIYFQKNIWYRFPEYEEIIIKLKIYFYGILPPTSGSNFLGPDPSGIAAGKMFVFVHIREGFNGQKVQRQKSLLLNYFSFLENASNDMQTTSKILLIYLKFILFKSSYRKKFNSSRNIIHIQWLFFFCLSCHVSSRWRFID